MKEQMLFLVRSFFTPAPRDFDNSNQIISLDALRGIAAIAVMFWHYQHFFYDSGFPTSIDVNNSTG